MDLVKELSTILDSERVLSDSESAQLYGQDWTRYYTPNPRAVVFPKSTEEVQKIVNWARTNSVALVPSGGRTGLSGGAVAKNGEVVVALDKMNQITDFNTTNQTVTCQGGVVTEALQNYVKEKGFYFPVDFASRGSSQIGGNIATNAGGIKVVRYGLFRNWVAGLTVVTGEGEILKLNNSLVKNATGYDLRHLFIGSEGTLGFITEAELNFTNPPKPLSVFVLAVPTLDAVMKIFETFRTRTSLVAFELFTDVAMKHVLEHFPKLSNPIATRAPLYVLVEFENDNEEMEAAALSAFELCAENEWLVDGTMNQSESQAQDFWALRENISEATSHATPYKNDISVTISKVPEFMTAVDKVLKNNYPNFEVVWFGHIGDGNLHINILKPKELSMDDFVSSCQKVDELLFKQIEEFGGSVSAEHGVGLSKKPFLQHTRSEAELQYMREIKKVFDPQGIMNPGKLI